MTDIKDNAKQSKYRAGDVVTLTVARLGEMGAFLDAGTGILRTIFCCINCSRRTNSKPVMKLRFICTKILMAG